MLGSPIIGGQKVNFIVLDDKSDTTEAVKNTRKLISEDKVDVIIGSTVTPNSLAMRDVVVEAEDPDDLDGGVGADHQPRRSENHGGCSRPRRTIR